MTPARDDDDDHDEDDHAEPEALGLPPPAPSMHDAGSVADVKATLAQLHEREASVTARLDALVASQTEFQRELGRLDVLRARLGPKARDAHALSQDMLADAAATAQRISGAVHRLDMEQSRVQATLHVVEQVAELKACVLGVAGSMGVSQDWETAAGYLSRASKISPDVVRGAFAAEVVPTAEVPDPPAVTLEHAAESLCGLFLREFERAVREGDDERGNGTGGGEHDRGARITRFFKLFPLIGRAKVGLDVYGRYVCQGVAARARATLHAGTGGAAARTDGLFFATALTRLFEHVAQIVNGHGPLVERHYGRGQMAAVMRRLQVEADVQGGIILDSWAEERQVDRRLTEVKSYAFTFLVQSFMAGSREASQQQQQPQQQQQQKQQVGEADDDEGVDLKEVDGLLREMSMMLARWSRYGGFLADKCRNDDDEDDEEDEDLQLPEFVADSALRNKLQERVVAPYGTMTTFFLRRTVEKAFQLEEAPSGLSLDPKQQTTTESGGAPTTSVVDDVMYIVQRVLRQAVDTGQVEVVRGVAATVGRVLGADFVGMMQRRMRDETYPRPGATENTVLSFLVLINNVDVAVDYVQRIVQGCVGRGGAHPSDDPHDVDDIKKDDDDGNSAAADLEARFPLAGEAAEAAAAVRGVATAFAGKAGELMNDGVQVAFNQVIKGRLRGVLADAFRDVGYDDSSGNEDTPDDAADGMTVRRRFAAGWEAAVGGPTRILSARAGSRLAGLAAGATARLLEKRIWGLGGRVSVLGAARLERDVHQIAGVVAATASPTSGYQYRLREVFGRCAQLAGVMALDADEWEESEADHDGAAAGLLNEDERVRARAMLRQK